MAYWIIQLLIFALTMLGMSQTKFEMYGYANTIGFYVIKATSVFAMTHFLIRAPIHYLRKKEVGVVKIIILGVCFSAILAFIEVSMRTKLVSILMPVEKTLNFYKENPDKDPLNKELAKSSLEPDNLDNKSAPQTFKEGAEVGIAIAGLEHRKNLDKLAQGDEDALRQQFNKRFSSQFGFLIIWLLCYLPLSALRRRTQIKSQLKQSQIALLMSQLNPHFLFNSLNSIRGMIFEDKTLAKELIDKLNELFKYNLTANKNAEVKLKEELRICEFYLDIEHIRLEERLLIEMHVDETCLNYKVPTMGLLTLIENSVKHGIAPRQEQSLLVVDISKQKNELVMTVTNPTYQGNYKVESTGTGQENLLKRLQLMYTEGALLETQEQGDKYIASLTIPV